MYLPNNNRRISYRINIGYRSLVLGEEFSEDGFKLFGFNVKERECSSKSISRQIWYGFNDDMVRLRHQYVAAYNVK